VYALEKMDGPNFRFGTDGDQLVFGSRNQVYRDRDQIPGPLQHAVEYIDARVDPDDLRPGATYFGEAMHEHTLEYDWESVPDVLGFAVYDHETDVFKSWPQARREFDRLGIDTVPQVALLPPEDLSPEYEIPDSEYRDGIAEGVVFWHENATRAKLRSEEFREKHDGNTSGPEDFEPSDGHEVLIEQVLQRLVDARFVGLDTIGDLLHGTVSLLGKRPIDREGVAGFGALAGRLELLLEAFDRPLRRREVVLAILRRGVGVHRPAGVHHHLDETTEGDAEVLRVVLPGRLDVAVHVGRDGFALESVVPLALRHRVLTLATPLISLRQTRGVSRRHEARRLARTADRPRYLSLDTPFHAALGT
jgi:hypothetical protein